MYWHYNIVGDIFRARLNYYLQVVGYREAVKELHVSRSTLDYWRSGERMPETLSLINHCATVFNCDIFDLFGSEFREDLRLIPLFVVHKPLCSATLENRLRQIAFQLQQQKMNS